MQWLLDNLFPFDEPNRESIATGIAPASVNLSLTARQRYPWAASVPRTVWRDAVLPYASVNEARTDWRALLTPLLTPLLDALPRGSSLADVALAVNHQVWSRLVVNVTGRSGNSIRFRSEQTPMIFDPLSVILFGYASCTGISILLIDALRVAGVPARLVGTPAWHGKPDDGNHNWVEVYVGPQEGSVSAHDGYVGAKADDIPTGALLHPLSLKAAPAADAATVPPAVSAADASLDGGWAFIEGSPAGAGESLTNPCDKWFCNAGHFGLTGTRVFAARYDRSPIDSESGKEEVSFPMAWNIKNNDVRGVDRTAYYTRVCTACSVVEVLLISGGQHWPSAGLNVH
jgi:hypothetical protein